MLIRTPLGQWVIEGDDYGVSGLVRAAGSFEYPANLAVLQRVAHLIPGGAIVVDAGASLGDQTVIYSQIVNDDGMVYAFEPHAESYEALELNTVRLRNVTLHNAALGSVPEEAAIFSVSPTNLGASFLGTMPEYPDFPVTHVEVTTLDIALAGVPRLDFIHLDAEGMEGEILKGATRLIGEHRPALLLEVTPRWLAKYGWTQQDLYDLLTRFGYDTPVPLQDNPYWFDVLVQPLGRTVTV